MKNTIFEITQSSSNNIIYAAHLIAHNDNKNVVIIIKI